MQSICQRAVKCALMYLALTVLAPQAGAQYREIGLANFYADYLQGKTTAYGEMYNPSQFTCAHPSHPPGTLLRVTRLDNGATVIVRVNDKGSFAEGFVISLSRIAASAIGIEQAGKTRVQVEIVEQAGDRVASTPYAPASYDMGFSERSPLTIPPAVPLTEKIAEPNAAMPTSRELLPRGWPSETPATRTGEYGPVPATPAAIPVSYDYGVPDVMNERGTAIAAPYTGPVMGRVSRVVQGFGGYGVQTSSFGSFENANRQAAALAAMGVPEVFIVEAKTSGNALVYRIVAGNFQTRIEAERHLIQLRDRHKLAGFIVTL